MNIKECRESKNKLNIQLKEIQDHINKNNSIKVSSPTREISVGIEDNGIYLWVRDYGTVHLLDSQIPDLKKTLNELYPDRMETEPETQKEELPFWKEGKWWKD